MLYEGYKNIILEGDVLNIIGPLRNPDYPPNWSIKPLIDDILYFVKFFENVYFSFVSREGNSLAHLIAQWVAFVNWFRHDPISNLLASVVQAMIRDGARLGSFCFSPI